MSFNGVIFYCSPSKIKDVSRTFEQEITQEQAEAIRDYYDTREQQAAYLASTILCAALVPVKPYVGFISGNIGGVVAGAIAEVLIEQDTDFDSVKGNCTVKGTYKYRRKGSYDGFFYLDEIEIID